MKKLFTKKEFFKVKSIAQRPKSELREPIDSSWIFNIAEWLY